jgi:hypothetical protein
MAEYFPLAILSTPARLSVPSAAPMSHDTAMKTWTSPLHRIADHLWTVLTLVLALILAAPAAMIVSAPFMKSQPAFVYDRYGCPIPGIGPDQARAAEECAREQAVDPVVDSVEPAAEGVGAE